jgi:hypothetical protein
MIKNEKGFTPAELAQQIGEYKLADILHAAEKLPGIYFSPSLFLSFSHFRAFLFLHHSPIFSFAHPLLILPSHPPLLPGASPAPVGKPTPATSATPATPATPAAAGGDPRDTKIAKLEETVVVLKKLVLEMANVMDTSSGDMRSLIYQLQKL